MANSSVVCKVSPDNKRVKTLRVSSIPELMRGGCS